MKLCYACARIAWKGSDACKPCLDELHAERGEGDPSKRKAALLAVAFATDLTPAERLRRVAALEGSEPEAWVGKVHESDRFRGDLY